MHPLHSCLYFSVQNLCNRTLLIVNGLVSLIQGIPCWNLIVVLMLSGQTPCHQSELICCSCLPSNKYNAFSILTKHLSHNVSLKVKAAPQFKNINSLLLSLVYGPILTSIHDYWKKHSFDYTDLGKVTSLLFNTLSMFVIALFPRIYPLPFAKAGRIYSHLFWVQGWY